MSTKEPCESRTTTSRKANHPNLQNIPLRTEEGRRIREAFHAPKGSLFYMDYSEVERRILSIFGVKEK